MINDISKMADKCEENGLPVIAAALREAHEEIEKLSSNLQCANETISDQVDVIQQLRAENERLKGKIVSHGVHTMCFCDDCGAATRWGRHLDIDCETIKQLRAEFKRFQDIFSPDVSIEMLEEGLQARVELPKLRAELQAANEELSQLKTLHKYSCESRDLEKQICEQDNAQLRKAIKELECQNQGYRGMTGLEPCACKVCKWKRNALKEVK